MPGLQDALGLTPIGMGLTGLSAAASIFGAIKSAKENKKNQDLLNQRQEENKAEYDNSANRSFLDTSAAKDAVRLNKENLVDAQKNVAGRSVITGASDEASVAANTGVQKNYNDTTSRLASIGTQYQDSQKRMYLSRKDSLDNQQMQLNQQKSDSAANLIGSAGNLLGTVTMGAGMNDKTKLPKWNATDGTTPD